MAAFSYSNQFGISGASEELDYDIQAEPFGGCFQLLSSSLVVEENAGTLFCCDAPKMFCVLRNVMQL